MIAQRIIELKSELPPEVKLVAVSKYKSAGAIMEAYAAGQRAFAESRPQELVRKAKELPEDIEWHFIGHLQTNKIKSILPYVRMIQSVDSIHLLEAIDTQAGLAGIKVGCLLEVHISREESKQGLDESEVLQIVANRNLYRNINLRGVMGMASFSDDAQLVHSEFKSLRRLADNIELEDFDTVSMGMSSDYRIAVEEGTNLVRIGTSIFGERNSK